MGYGIELKNTPAEQIPHAEDMNRMDFDKENTEHDRACFAVCNITSL